MLAPGDTQSEECGGVLGSRRLALLALLAATLLLLVGPALIAGISMIDSRSLDRAYSWSKGGSMLISYLGYGCIPLALVLAVQVSSTVEDP